MPKSSKTSEVDSTISVKGLNPYWNEQCEEINSKFAHKDRLARFGFELIEWIVQQSGGKVVVLKQTNLSSEQELTNDLLSILHVFSYRMPGLGNYKNQVRQALSEPEAKADI